MTRENAKALLPIIQAYAEGKKIIVKDKRLSDEKYNWSEVDDCSFNIEQFEYRIKPESKYRPFNDAKECWAEMQEHQPFGWLRDSGGYYVHVVSIGKTFIGTVSPSGINISKSFSNFYYDDYTFADGTPFGVKVEE